MKHSILWLMVALSLLPIAVRAQYVPIFEVRVTASLTVHRGPGPEHLMVGYLEPGMPARIFSCNVDCTWLEMGPNVWIPGDRVTLVQGQLPSGLSLPVPISLALPAATPTAVPPPTPTPGRGLRAGDDTGGTVVNGGGTETSTANSGGEQCDPSYPDVCIPPISVAGDLDCPDIPQYARFRVLPPDPHGLDGPDNDGVGCEGN